jgi:CBS domain-containing protein
VKAVDPQSAEEWIIGMIKEGHQSSMQISDLMSSPVFTVAPKIKMKKVALLLREKGCTGIPVVDGGSVVGIISRRDFRKIKKPPQLGSPVKAFMSTRLIHIGPEKNVGQAVKLMVKNDIGRLPVVKNERLIGILTRSDVMQHYYCERSC